MEFGLRLPEVFSKLNPFAKSSNEVVRKYLKGNDTKRLSFDISQRRQFIADMQQDELLNAILLAENPQMPQRYRLLEMYRQAVREPHTRSQIATNMNKTIGSPFGVFKKGTEDIDEEATQLLTRPWFEKCRTYFHEARLYGHSLIEFGQLKYNEESGKNEFSDVKLFPREHVRQETGEILIEPTDTEGIPFREPPFNKWLLEAGDPLDLGLLVIVTKEVIWKKYSRSDWSRASEKFGMPILAIKSASKDKKEIARLEQMASNFGSNLWVILDDQDEVQIIESKSSTGKGHLVYLDKAKYCDEMISKTINGQTGTSDVKAFAGSAEVHEHTQDDFIESNKRSETYWNNFVLFPFLIEKGYDLKDREFRYIDIDKDGGDDPDMQDEEDANKKKRTGGSGKKKQLAQGFFR